MNKVSVTSLDGAKRAGVSQSAGSRVFTPGASASAATVEKVREAARELGYRPNPIARAMITGKSRIIGLVLAYLDNQFYPIALQRLSTVLQERGYHVLVFMVQNTSDSVDEIVQDLLDYRVDGIVAASVAFRGELVDRCADSGIPVVLFNRGQDGGGVSTVTSANVAGGARVAEFLVGAGHERIAHIAGWQGSSTGRDRKRGFIDGLAQLERSAVAVVDGMYDQEVASAATLELFNNGPRPDAIFVGNDHMAFAVMDALRGKLGLSVPDDVSVVGYDDVPLASWDAYDLTTVRQPVNQMVDATVETLLAEIDSHDRPEQKIEIHGPLIVRGSARVPEGWPQ